MRLRRLARAEKINAGLCAVEIRSDIPVSIQRFCLAPRGITENKQIWIRKLAGIEFWSSQVSHPNKPTPESEMGQTGARIGDRLDSSRTARGQQ
jgi:hypothetical protein